MGFLEGHDVHDPASSAECARLAEGGRAGRSIRQSGRMAAMSRIAMAHPGGTGPGPHAIIMTAAVFE
jgi:hypothetical protein